MSIFIFNIICKTQVKSFINAIKNIASNFFLNRSRKSIKILRIVNEIVNKCYLTTNPSWGELVDFSMSFLCINFLASHLKNMQKVTAVNM